MFVAVSGSAFVDTLIAIMLVLTACGCVLVGISLMSRGFVHASLKTDSFFTRGFNCKNRFFGAGFGLMHTAIVQSSDVTSVTLVRLADIGYITLFQACACLIGANVGTTITSFIVSASGATEYITEIFAFFAFVGAIPLLSKKKHLKTFGEIVGGFGILFIGIYLLGNACENPAFENVIKVIFKSTTSPLLLILIALMLTMIVQSSSVVTSMVIIISMHGLLPLSSALCLVVGANIGTCVTAWIAAIGSSKTARQTALFHTLFNTIGASIFLVLMYSPLKSLIIEWADGLSGKVEWKISTFHLLFNLTAAMVMIPLLRPNVWLCKKIVRH